MDKEALFAAALELSTPADRRAFLDEMCGPDAGLRRNVERLLAANAKAAGILECGAKPRWFDSQVSPSALAVDAVFAGRFKLRQKLGEGGMGEVWAADQFEPVQRHVALKVVRPGLDSGRLLARFGRERQALALMDHPNIARVLDAGVADSRPYFVMELIDGVPITAYCDAARLTLRERLELFLGVCHAVQHAHQKGIIHRDLKPSNILVAQCDGRAVPKVIDFGVAKTNRQGLTEQDISTEFGTLVGTLEYMSPEQAELNSVDIDTRSDVYSLGVILYELITGSVPFSRRELPEAAFNEMLRLIRDVDPPKPSVKLSGSAKLPGIAVERQTEPKKLVAQVRDELDWIAMKCLEKDRARRYETANALACDIQHHLADEPVDACPPSAAYRLRKFARSNWRLLATTAAFMFLLMVGVAVSVVLAVRATHAERQALSERDAKDEALQAEAQQRRRADDKAAIAKAVNEFLLKNLLGQADIGNQPGTGARDRDVSVRVLLDRAAQGIETQFEDQLQTKAAILHTVGRAYGALGEYPQAQKHLERSLALRKQELGADHPDTLKSMGELARLHQARGQYGDAELLYEQALSISRKNLGVDHADTLTALHNLAFFHRVRDRYDKAEPLSIQALEGRRRVFGDEHPDTLESMNNLAVLHWNLGRHDAAEPLFKQVQQVSRLKYGVDHPLTLTAMQNLATLYHSRRRYTEAETLSKQVLEVRRLKLGADHPATLMSMSNLAALYIESERHDEAEALCKNLLETRRVKLGADHPDTLNTMNDLGTLYWSRKQLNNSIPIFEEVLALQRNKLGADDPDTLLSLANLGINYRDAGRTDDGFRSLEEAWALARKRPGPLRTDLAALFTELADSYDRANRLDKAEPLYRELLDRARKQYGADEVRVTSLMAKLGTNLLRQKKYSDAQAVLAETLAIREKKEPNLWTTFNTKSQLGGALLGQEKYADAERLLVQGFEGMKSREATIHSNSKVRLTQALERLVQLYDNWGKPDEAAKWRRELESVRKDTAALTKPKDK